MQPLKVSDEFRTNPLSLKPGGSKVNVLYSDGMELIYDKVKSPASYIRTISSKSPERRITSVKVNGKVVWTPETSSDPWDFTL